MPKPHKAATPNRRVPREIGANRACSLLFALVALVSVGCAGRRAAPVAQPGNTPAVEFRAFWVDAFHAGIRSPQEAAQLVADAKRANINTLIVQVRRRGDSLYKKSLEPPLDDPAYDPQFDALEYIVELAHREGLEVHAWVNAMPVWRDEKQPPAAAGHVFNLHGPAQAGEENWLTSSPAGEQRFPVGYFLDPGHPAAAVHVAEVYLNIVRNYAVDGIHFDYIRYPETTERLPRGAAVGYNAVALARFRRATGRTDTPAPGDEQWMDWRRKQATQIVRRVYLEAKSINPRIKVSAALIPWGKPPASEKDFLDAAPGQRIFQDWHAWLKAGYLDLAIPMNYAREADATVRGWFDGWIRWEKKHKHGRQLAIGLGAYLNLPHATLAQAERARQREGRHAAVGLSLFSYANLYGAPPAQAGQVAGTQNAPQAQDRLSFLSTELPAWPANLQRAPVFSKPAAIPPMDWIEKPTRGMAGGTIRDETGVASDGAEVRVRRRRFLFARTLRTESDGNGFFGFTNLKPGRYRAWWGDGAQRRDASFEVTAGNVARIEFPPR
jgi:uncharacterized lipoprotein YddW (UPF0748 family)